MFGLSFIDLITIIAIIILLAWVLLNDFSLPTTGTIFLRVIRIT